MEFFRSVVAQDVTISADGTVSHDLEIRPTSHIVFTIKCLNSGTNTKATLAQILGAIEKVEILRFGASIVSISGADLYALNTILLGREPWQENVVNTDNAVRHLSLVIPFGRRLYDPNECFPETTAGELSLQYTVDIADTGYDGFIEQIEQVEIIGAKPKRYLKYMTKSYTPSATGAAEVDLPRGNLYAGILLYGTTVPTGTAWTTTIDKVRLLVNNEEHYYGICNWESLHGELISKCSPAGAWSEKIHMENTDATYTQNADTAAEEQDDTALANYVYLDFSPNNSDDFLLSTRELSGLKLEITAGDTNATRITPVELVEIK